MPEGCWQILISSGRPQPPGQCGSHLQSGTAHAPQVCTKPYDQLSPCPEICAINCYQVLNSQSPVSVMDFLASVPLGKHELRIDLAELRLVGNFDSEAKYR